MNANISGIDNNYTPLIIKPSTIKGINYQMEVASAQVKSAILLASLFSKEATTLTEFDVSRNHTETLFAHFNIPISIQGKTIQTIPYAIEHIQPRDFHVPGDISSAAFFIVAALITPGSDITIHNVGINPTRSGIIDIVKQMGGNIELSNVSKGAEPTASIHVKYTPNLNAVTIKGDLVQGLSMNYQLLHYFAHKLQILVLSKRGRIKSEGNKSYRYYCRHAKFTWF